MAETEVKIPIFEDEDGVSDPEDRCPCLGDGEPMVLFWFKQEGQEVTEGEPLVEIEIGWFVKDVDAPASGRVSAIFKAAGQKVSEGDTIGVIESGRE